MARGWPLAWPKKPGRPGETARSRPLAPDPRKAISRAILAAVLAVAGLTGCSYLPKVVKGQTFTVGMLGSARSVLSTVSQTPGEQEVSANLYRPLWDYDSSWRTVPGLAETEPKSKLNEDHRSLSTELATALWSDGEPLQGIDFDTGLRLAGKPEGGRAQVPWKRSVRDVEVTPDGLVANLNGFWPSGGLNLLPFPTQAAGKLGTDPLSDYGHSPLSCGPYLVKEWVGEGRLITLTVNPNFRWDPGAKRLETIRYRFYDRPDRMIRGIMAGDIQLAPRIDQEVFKQTQNNKWLQPRWVRTDRLQCLVLRLDSPALSELAVRRALFGGLRRSQWVHTVFPAEANVKPATSWVPEQAWFSLDVLHRVEEEQSDPNQTLKRAGWTGKVRAKGTVTLQLELIYDDKSEQAARVAEQVKTYWELLGVEVIPTPVNDMAERMARRDFAHLALTELPLEPWMSPGQVLGRIGLPSEKDPGGLNYSGWLDEGHEAICYAIERAADKTELKPLLAREQQRFAEEMPIFPLYFIPERHLVSPQLDGYEPRGFGAASFNSEKWTYTPPPITERSP